MATKTTKASARGTKTTTKKKKKGILSKINFYSRKTQLVVVALLVAVVGGGYYTYKSFAATGSWTYTVANGGLVAGAGTSVIDGKTGKGKNGESIIAVPKDKAALTSQVHIPIGQLYRVCLVAKNPSGAQPVGGVVMWPNKVGANFGAMITNGSGTISKDLGNGYREYCTGRLTTGHAGAVIGQGSVINKSTSQLYISSMTIIFVN